MRLMLSMLYVLLTCVLHAQDAPPTVNIAGAWEGSLKVGAIQLRLGFTLKADDKGNIAGTMVSIDQGNAEIPVSKATVTRSEMKILVPKAAASFTGTLNAAADTAEGHWMQGLNKLPLTLKKVKSVTKLVRPQEPKPPFPYKAEEVSYENAAAKVKLAGTFTIPPGDGPFPAVLLITGSGPQDRDESLLGHKPFAVLADYLTRRGIAVLRVDDRGVGKSTGKFTEATSFDFADDAMAGVQFLKRRKEVEGKRIGLMGHSEGGIIAPIVASKSTDVAFIVLLAGTGLNGEEIIYLQSRLIAEAEGGNANDTKVNEMLQRKMFALVKAEPASPELVKKLQALAREEVAKLSPEHMKELEKAGGMTTLNASLSEFSKPWFKTFLTFDPTTVLKQVKCPVLAINGELDLQVPYKENLEAIRKALESAGNTQVTTRSFPQLNHLFQKCKTGSPTEYGKIEETFNVEALKVIGDWIAERK